MLLGNDPHSHESTVDLSGFAVYRGSRPDEESRPLSRLLEGLGTATVRASFYLVRFEGAAAEDMAQAVRTLAGPVRPCWPLGGHAYLIVDIGPRGGGDATDADRRLTAAFASRLDAAVMAMASTWGGAEASLTVLHRWTSELSDAEQVFAELDRQPVRSWHGGAMELRAVG